MIMAMFIEIFTDRFYCNLRLKNQEYMYTV